VAAANATAAVNAAASKVAEAMATMALPGPPHVNGAAAGDGRKAAAEEPKTNGGQACSP
jgi:hypothetical protein